MKPASIKSLRPAKAFRFYENSFKYIVLYDYAAGSKNRYTVLILTADDPVTIGRELPLGHCASVIRDMEKFAPKDGWMGDRATAVRCHNRCIQSRLRASVVDLKG